MSLFHETLAITVGHLLLCARCSLQILYLQSRNHQAIASTPNAKVLGLKLNYMFGQALRPNLITRHSVTFGSYKINYSDNDRVRNTVSLPM